MYTRPDLHQLKNTQPWIAKEANERSPKNEIRLKLDPL